MQPGQSSVEFLMTLHCVYSGAHTTHEALIRQLAEDDCILLLGDACVLALPGNPSLDGLNDWRVYALDEDLAARGIETADTRVQAISYEAWLELTVQQANQRLWR